MPGLFGSGGIGDEVGDFSISGKLNLGMPEELTISSGAVLITMSNHIIDTEADAETDDLDTINGGDIGDLLIIRAVDNSRTVVVKDGGGNLRIDGDFSLTHVQDSMMLLFIGTNWVEISRSNNAS